MNPITLKGVWKNYGERTALRDVTFEVEEGEVLAVIGPSGSGKTTLLRIIDLLDRPSRGTILFAGEEPDDENERRRIRRMMGMVFQQPVLFDTTVYENIACSLEWRDHRREEVRKRVSEVLSLVRLTGMERRPARSLSGGEKQRVVIASAIAAGPRLLLMDEATANLDPANASIIEDAVRKINSSEGVTVILATHNLFQARRLADRVVFLLDGQVLEMGDREELFEKPRDARTRSFLRGEMVY